MFVQETYLSRIRTLIDGDPRISHALMYGSFSRGDGSCGEADRYSDIEFYFFLAPDELALLDRASWAREVAPVDLAFENEFGTFVVVFEGSVRAEFHFEETASVGDVAGWIFERLDPERMLWKDPDGGLRRALEHAVLEPLFGHGEVAARREQSERLLNWLLLASNVYRRGEDARALDALGYAHRFLLRGLRLAEEWPGESGKLDHWLNPTRALESRIDEVTRDRFAQCTAALDARALASALRACWCWGEELAQGTEIETAWRKAADVGTTLIGERVELIGEGRA